MTNLVFPPSNTILHGDCIDVLGGFASASFDFALTDPPYLVRYESRTGKRVHNDDNSAWLRPAFNQIHRVMKLGSYCVSFYGWNRVDQFVDAWTAAGFRIVGHLVFRKQYASSGKLLRFTHECAYLLAKGHVAPPSQPIADVIEWKYTGNRLHPTQKPVNSLRPLIESFCPVGGLVLDPFCGSGSTLVAAHKTGRAYLGIEIDSEHHTTAQTRLAALDLRTAA
jgi:site-specific DNA-methyltransferase (adenine-specific)